MYLKLLNTNLWPRLDTWEQLEKNIYDAHIETALGYKIYNYPNNRVD